ncbi:MULTISPECIES: helix-turn-helix domain-containing protein [Sphingomonas]|nr:MULTISPECIES: helix-turn-helix domain-containing protein [Sphingomonas]
MALELVGERWSLLIVRELMFGPRRFNELRNGLPGISANVLTQRLEGMEASGMLTRRKLPPPASVQVYELTRLGYAAETVVKELGRWAAQSPLHDPTLPLSAASVMLSFRTMLDAGRAEGIDAQIGFRFGEEEFRAHLADGAIPIRRGEAAGAELVFTTMPTVLAAAVYGGVPLAELEKAGVLSIEGNRSLAERFVTLFPLPPKLI